MANQRQFSRCDFHFKTKAERHKEIMNNCLNLVTKTKTGRDLTVDFHRKTKVFKSNPKHFNNARFQTLYTGTMNHEVNKLQQPKE